MTTLASSKKMDRFEIDVPRDRWGRPIIPSVENPGTTFPGLRPSGVGSKFLDDKWNINKWVQRTIVKGMGVRPELGLLAAPLDVKHDKNALHEVVEEAITAGGGNKASSTGTAIHSVCERLLLGEDPDVSPTIAGQVEAMKQAMARVELTVVDGLVEPFLINEKAQAGGSADAIVTCNIPEAEGNVIFDLKTGGHRPSEFSSPMTYGIQLAIYARSTHSWKGVGTDPEPLPPLNTDVGLILWVPAEHETGHAEFVGLDLKKGWAAFELAMKVKAERQRIKQRYVLFTDVAAVTLSGEAEPAPDPKPVEPKATWPEPAPSKGELRKRLLAARADLKNAVEGTGSDKGTILAIWPDGVPGLTPEQFAQHDAETVWQVEAFVLIILDMLNWVTPDIDDVNAVVAGYEKLDDDGKAAVNAWKQLNNMPNITAVQAKQWHVDRALTAVEQASRGEEINA